LPPKTFFKLCRILNNEIYTKVKIGEHLSSEFKANKGVRQGNAFAPLLFHILLEIAIRKCRVESWGNKFDKCS
jgi:hypothetical protein